MPAPEQMLKPYSVVGWHQAGASGRELGLDEVLRAKPSWMRSGPCKA